MKIQTQLILVALAGLLLFAFGCALDDDGYTSVTGSWHGTVTLVQAEGDDIVIPASNLTRQVSLQLRSTAGHEWIEGTMDGWASVTGTIDGDNVSIDVQIPGAMSDIDGDPIKEELSWLGEVDNGTMTGEMTLWVTWSVTNESSFASGDFELSRFTPDTPQ